MLRKKINFKFCFIGLTLIVCTIIISAQQTNALYVIEKNPTPIETKPYDPYKKIEYNTEPYSINSELSFENLSNIK